MRLGHATSWLVAERVPRWVQFMFIGYSLSDRIDGHAKRVPGDPEPRQRTPVLTQPGSPVAPGNSSTLYLFNS